MIFIAICFLFGSTAGAKIKQSIFHGLFGFAQRCHLLSRAAVGDIILLLSFVVDFEIVGLYLCEVESAED